MVGNPNLGLLYIMYAVVYKLSYVPSPSLLYRNIMWNLASFSHMIFAPHLDYRQSWWKPGYVIKLNFACPASSKVKVDFYLCGHSTLSIFRMQCMLPLPLLDSDFVHWIIASIGNANTGIPISASFCRNILFQLWHICDIIPNILLDIVDSFFSNLIMSYSYARCLMLQTFIKPYLYQFPGI